MELVTTQLRKLHGTVAVETNRCHVGHTVVSFGAVAAR